MESAPNNNEFQQLLGPHEEFSKLQDLLITIERSQIDFFASAIKNGVRPEDLASHLTGAMARGEAPRVILYRSGRGFDTDTLVFRGCVPEPAWLDVHETKKGDFLVTLNQEAKQRVDQILMDPELDVTRAMIPFEHDPYTSPIRYRNAYNTLLAAILLQN